MTTIGKNNYFTVFLLFQARGARAVFQLYPENSSQVKFVCENDNLSTS